MGSKIARVFSGADVKHGLALFTPEEIDWIEQQIIENYDQIINRLMEFYNKSEKETERIES
jgi:hypothetical protein